MYAPSRNLFSFHIAGFQHHDGALVLGKLKAGAVSYTHLWRQGGARKSAQSLKKGGHKIYVSEKLVKIP